MAAIAEATTEVACIGGGNSAVVVAATAMAAVVMERTVAGSSC